MNLVNPLRSDTSSVDGDRSFRRRYEPHYHIDRSGLSGSVGPDKSNYLTFLNTERNVVNSLEPTELLRDRMNVDYRLGITHAFSIYPPSRITYPPKMRGTVRPMHNQYSKVADAQQITQSITRIATQIIQDHPATPLFVSLLRGAAPFSSMLMFELARQAPEFHPEIDYMMVSTYGGERHASKPHIVTDLAPSTTVTGRTVVIIDDVLDKGITAQFVTVHLLKLGAAEVKLAVLCDKRTQKSYDITPDYSGFTFEDNWLVGIGMDDARAATEGYRWLDEIWEVNQ